MSKIRIYKLAKELNISNTELVAFLEKMGFHANSHSSHLDDATARSVRERFKIIEINEQAEQRRTPDLIRRASIKESKNKDSNLTGTEKYKNIIARCTERISLNPDDKFAYLERGDAHIHLGNPQEALSNYRRALELNQSLSKAYYGMAAAHIMLGAKRLAMVEIEKAIELGHQDDAK